MNEYLSQKCSEETCQYWLPSGGVWKPCSTWRRARPTCHTERHQAAIPHCSPGPHKHTHTWTALWSTTDCGICCQSISITHVTLRACPQNAGNCKNKQQHTYFCFLVIDKLYSPQMVATIYKYTTENNLTNKREKKKHTRLSLSLCLFHVFIFCCCIDLRRIKLNIE